MPPPCLPPFPIRFELGAAIGGYLGLLQAESTLRPFFSNLPHAAIPAATSRLLSLWRARVMAFREHDWGGLNGPRCPYYWRMLNCAPAFVNLERPAVACCGRPLVCPFCWARFAGDLWKRCDNVLYADSAPEHDLIVRTATYTLSIAGRRGLAHFLERRVRGGAPAHKPFALPPRGKELQLLRAAGVLGMVDVTRVLPFEPPASYDPTLDPANALDPVPGPFGWQVVVRQLLLVPAGRGEAVGGNPTLAPPDFDERFRRLYDPQPQIAWFSRPSRRDFVHHVARILAYPAFLLTDTLERTMAALDVCARRLVATGGIFYGQG